MHGGTAALEYGRLREIDGGVPAERRAFGAPYERDLFHGDGVPLRTFGDPRVPAGVRSGVVSADRPAAAPDHPPPKRAGSVRAPLPRNRGSEADRRPDHGARPAVAAARPRFLRHRSGLLADIDRRAGAYALLCTLSQHSAEPGSLIIEVFGGVEDIPLEVVNDTITRFQTEARGVLLHIAPDVDTVRRLSGVGAHCLAIDFAGVAHEGARDWLGAAELVQAARRTCGQLLLVNLRPDRALAAQAAGATHTVFSTLEPRTL